MIYKTAFLLLIFILHLNAKSLENNSVAYVALQQREVCAVSEKEAIIKVDVELQKITGIDSKYLHSKNIYIRHEKNTEGEFCVEGIVTQKGFALYDAQLEEEYEVIMGEIEDLNDGIAYTQKQAEVDRLFNEIVLYNQKIKRAEQIATLRSEKIEETKISLDEMINAVPVVKFKIEGCEGKFKAACQLLFISSFQDDSSTVVYSWNFDDGSFSKRTNPLHVYKRAGTYNVSLRITDGGKKYAEVSQKIYVAAKPKPRPKEKPVANFSSGKKVYVKGEKIDFINLSSTKQSKVTEYRWNFGDGLSSKLSNPKHSYNKTGTFKVSLAIVNSDGLSSNVGKSIHVVHPAILFGIDGRKYNRIVRKYGQPERSIERANVLTKAYQYGSDWLLVKQNKVVCRINGNAFKTNLMGNPKNCRWYEKHARSAMYE